MRLRTAILAGVLAAGAGMIWELNEPGTREPLKITVSKAPASVESYLFERYLQSPKIDQWGDFGWKDPAAAEVVGMSLKEYVIGGLEPSFKYRLYRLIVALDAAGLKACITTAYRGPERQAMITKGFRAKVDVSYHGGNGKERGHGHGSAADIVSCEGKTRAERQANSALVWQWIDSHSQTYEIKRPYGNKDAPHVGPIDGIEAHNHMARTAINHKKMAKVAKR